MLHNTKIRINEFAHENFTPHELRIGVSSPELRSRPQDVMSDLSEDYQCSRVKLLCSYGGRILPRPSDGRLRYVGGETRIITVSRDIIFPELMMKMLEIHRQTVSLKYQLPDEDLDALVSVCSNEDLENMMDEYETSPRIRVFLFSGDYDVEHFSDSSAEHRNSEQLYLDAINGILDSASAKHSGSGVSDITQDLENLIGIELGDRWSASSMDDTQASQSSFPVEQPLPVPSQFSLRNSFPRDLFSTPGLSPPFSSIVSSKHPAIFSIPAISVTPPNELHETINGKFHSSSSSSDATTPILSSTCSTKFPMAAPAKVIPDLIFTEPVPIVQNEPVSVFPPIVTAFDEPHLDLGQTQNGISGPQQFTKLFSDDDLQNALEQSQENPTIATVSRVSPTFGSDREGSLLEQDSPQASQHPVSVDDLIARDVQRVEKVLKTWSDSVAVGNAALQSASSALPDQVSTATLQDFFKFSPKIETIQQIKLSNGSDPSSEPQWTLSEAPTNKERAAYGIKEPSQWQRECSLRVKFLEENVTRENTPINVLPGSHLPNFLDLDPIAGVRASCLKSQTLQQQESQPVFPGQLSKLEHAEEHRGPQEQVVLAAEQEISSGGIIAQLENLIDLDMQQDKHDLDMLSMPNTTTMQSARIEPPNYLDSVFRHTKSAPQGLFDHDISSDISSQLASSISLNFDAISEQNVKFTLPEDLYVHPLVSLPKLNISGGQNPPDSVDLLGDSKLTSPTTCSNDVSLLENFEELNIPVVDASKTLEKPASSGHRISVGVQVDEISQLSAEMDKLEELLVGPPSGANQNMDVTEQYLNHGQGYRLSKVIPNEEAEKAPGHSMVLLEPSTDIFFDLLTSPANVPPQLLTPSGTINPTTTTSIQSKSNVLEIRPLLLPDPSDVDLLLLPNISLDNNKAMCKANSSSAIQDSYEQLKQTGKITKPVELQESFSFSAGQQIESGMPQNAVVQNPNMGKAINIADPIELEVAAETNLEEYESVHASLIEEVISSNNSVTASAAELEAIARGLQIIRNADLEERRELGSGTFGTVFHGKWRGSDVAIKRIKASCFAGSPSEQERLKADFWREACILAQLHHPNVVAFYGVVPDGPGGTLATVTEYMINGSLKQFLRKNERLLDRRRRLIIAMDSTFGMEYLHSKNIVHFDLKCDNLLVNMRDPHRPICKVGDLGLSKVKHQTLVSGGVRGTLPWMAPELLNGNSSKVCEKVDVFSFGIVMWELLTGEEPYADLHYGAIIGGIVNNTLRPTVPKWCDSAWRSLMERCWAADPGERPSFTEIAFELRAMSTPQLSKAQGQNQV